MSDTTGEAAAQGAEAAPAQGATAQGQGSDAAPVQGTAAPQGEVSVETLTKKLAELEKDNRAYRQRETAREAAAKAQATAEMTEVERLTTENNDLRAQMQAMTTAAQEQSLRTSAVEVATRLGYKNPDIAFAHLVRSREQLTFDETGQPTNVEKMLRALAESDPYLVVNTDFGGGQRGAPVQQGQDMNALIRSAAKH
jgi:hypothetical protein